MIQDLFQTMIQKSLERKAGSLTDTGAFAVRTGRFTGRATQQRFVCDRPEIHSSIDWGKVNQPFEVSKTEGFFRELRARLNETEFRFHGYAGPFEVEVRSTSPWHIAFCVNMFRHRSFEASDRGDPIRVWHAPDLKASDLVPGYSDETLIVLDLARREVGIVGTFYAGEIKKSVFTTCNYWAPEYGSFPMHASANCREDASNSCVLFGLSGTGKTTLSASPDRALIGDDEIIWDEKGLYNLEGGCYAKLIDLSLDREPEIYRAVQTKSAILENVVLGDTGQVDYTDRSLTENTRGSYPLEAISNVFHQDRRAEAPKTVVFLTADAFGALPAVARLDEEQTKYFFVSGYTAKVAGTEQGIKEPRAAFSACFGAPFMPRPAEYYAKLLIEKVRASGATVWLLNTGWTRGGYGVGERFPLKVSRAILRAIQSGDLARVSMQKHPVFGFDVPMQCPDVPVEFLELGDLEKAKELKARFEENSAQLQRSAQNSSL
jgi:phosphoenolpyruvate carboxykinase (ATP)